MIGIDRDTRQKEQRNHPCDKSTDNDSKEGIIHDSHLGRLTYKQVEIFLSLFYSGFSVFLLPVTPKTLKI